MARTRAQEKAGTSSNVAADKPATQEEKKGAKRKAVKAETGFKRKTAPNISADERASKPEPATKKAKPADSGGSIPNNKIKKLIDTYGAVPLSGYGLLDPEAPTAETVLAHLLNAMLTSARISHELAEKSVKCLVAAGWADVNKLKESSWEKRTEVLTRGGQSCTPGVDEHRPRA